MQHCVVVFGIESNVARVLGQGGGVKYYYNYFWHPKQESLVFPVGGLWGCVLPYYLSQKRKI